MNKMASKKKQYVYLNGRMVAGDRALVPVFDRGLLYGDALFETMSADGGRAVRRDEHMERLSKGARLLGIPEKSLDDLFKDVSAGAIERLLKKNGLNESAARVRITVTRGVYRCGYAQPPDEATIPTFFITAEPVDVKGIERVRTKGVKGTLIRGFAPALPGIKTTNFLPNVLGKAEAKSRGAFEGIFVDEKGVVSEGTATNLFIVKSGVVKTPALSTGSASGGPISRGVLPGVTRRAVIDVARKNRIRVREAQVTDKALTGADEAFLTSSVLGIVPLTQVDGRPIGAGVPGETTRLIQALYQEACD